ncbi:MAG: helicase-related protein, partial [Mariprofundaceae bacterium]|nr:helicase-related protein [Mariprofundaceae bacterium]
AMAQCLDAGYQAVLMAPTTVLAVQHEQTLAALFAPLGVDVALLTGSSRASERKKINNRLHSGTLRLLIGTHALLSDDVQFSRLGLAIVDEQHRFGVRQRWALTEKGGAIHLLAMSATPIPRTLALGLYDDLAMTVMRGMPAGRLPVETRVLSAQGRGALAAGIQRLLDQNAYCYWITPRIDDDDVSVMKRAEALRGHFPHAGVQALHGRMKAAEKNQALADFTAGRCRLLVATTVVEVGVNVPEARLIVIEDADCYGLAQLHQLRGRVGRSNQQAYCVLMPAPNATAAAVQRLQYLVQYHDGLTLAELDLELRGSGDAMGVQQSGVVGFRVLDWMEDAPLIRQAHTQTVDVSLPPVMRNFWRPVSDAVD